MSLVLVGVGRERDPDDADIHLPEFRNRLTLRLGSYGGRRRLNGPSWRTPGRAAATVRGR